MNADADYVRSRLPNSTPVEPLDSGRWVFEPGSDDPQMLALYLGLLDADFTVIDAPELLDALASLRARVGRAISASRAAASDVARRH